MKKFICEMFGNSFDTKNAQHKEAEMRLQNFALFLVAALLFFSGFVLFNCAAQESAWKNEPGTYAVFETNHGTIVCKLLEKSAPKTVANFIGLAEGTKPFTDPKTGEQTLRRFYDGTIFHRVIPDFMIQGGDPTGTGRGHPGYRFEDEIDPELKFDKAGRLAMANSGPGTNGSQFFITHKATPFLNGKHTIFGQVIEGQKVVDKIGSVETTANNNRPVQDVVLKKVTIVKVSGKK